MLMMRIIQGGQKVGMTLDHLDNIMIYKKVRCLGILFQMIICLGLNNLHHCIVFLLRFLQQQAKKITNATTTIKFWLFLLQLPKNQIAAVVVILLLRMTSILPNLLFIERRNEQHFYLTYPKIKKRTREKKGTLIFVESLLGQSFYQVSPIARLAMTSYPFRPFLFPRPHKWYTTIQQVATFHIILYSFNTQNNAYAQSKGCLFNIRKKLSQTTRDNTTGHVNSASFYLKKIARNTNFLSLVCLL